MRSSSNPQPTRGPVRGHRAIAMFAVLAIAIGLIAHGGFAATKGKTITLGENLSEPQKQELLDYFKAKSSDRVEIITVDQTKKAMKGILDENLITSAFSSTVLTCRDLGAGLDVTTRNITLITPSLYAMALVTAGIGDAKLVVAAPNDAPAQGMTALAGVFLTWDIAPCDSGSTTKERQSLALKQLALAVDIGQTFVSSGVGDGIQRASNLVLETQKSVVIEQLTTADQISQSIAAQEQVFGVQIPAELRQRLVDLMVDLAKEKIDWSTFSAGWTIEYGADGTQIKMVGDGIAIRNAQMTATARASLAMTQTAEANAAALTATALAQPTVTPTPEPTATPAPFGVTGTISDKGDGQIWIKPSGGGNEAAFVVDPDATIQRGGKTVAFDQVSKGDRVTLTIDGSTNHIRAMSATAAGGGPPILPILIGVALIGFGALAFLLKGGVGGGEPFVVKRVAHA